MCLSCCDNIGNTTLKLPYGLSTNEQKSPYIRVSLASFKPKNTKSSKAKLLICLVITGLLEDTV